MAARRKLFWQSGETRPFDLKGCVANARSARQVPPGWRCCPAGGRRLSQTPHFFLGMRNQIGSQTFKITDAMRPSLE
jgi:hypothetical protein